MLFDIIVPLTLASALLLPIQPILERGKAGVYTCNGVEGSPAPPSTAYSFQPSTAPPVLLVPLQDLGGRGNVTPRHVGRELEDAPAALVVVAGVQGRDAVVTGAPGLVLRKVHPPCRGIFINDTW